MSDWGWLHRLPSRERTIVQLLENYQDVINGLRDTSPGSDDWGYMHAMCDAWNTPANGYPELERLRIRLRDEQPAVYWHVAERWLRTDCRRVFVCPHCGREGEDGSVHRHGRDSYARVPRMVPRVSSAVSPDVCRAGVDWLSGNWAGSPFLPDALLHLAA